MEQVQKVFGDFADEAGLRLQRSYDAGLTKYTPAEILAAFEQVDAVNLEIKAHNQKLEVLRDEYANESGIFVFSVSWWNERTKAPVPENLTEVNCQCSAKEPYPVKRWLGDVAVRRRGLNRRAK